MESNSHDVEPTGEAGSLSSELYAKGGMEAEDWLGRYFDLNKSFQKRLVFRFGGESGFFSEYNNLLLAMIFCLKHKIRFEIYSGYSRFAFFDAWSDFFENIPLLHRCLFNKSLNRRPYVIELSQESLRQKTFKYRYLAGAYKTLFGVDYLTQDLWDFHRDPEFAYATLTVPELGFDKAPLLTVAQKLIGALWRYNARSTSIITDLINNVNLPADYISIHVRAGDKSTETKTFDFSEYMVPAERFSNKKAAFILTDDFTVIEQLRVQFPAWHFQTLCQISERGYFHGDFSKLDPAHKYLQHLKLFASVDICAKSSRFIGTYSSNPGMYMGMRIGPERCFCLDFDHWLIW
jgi:hypothetical protein